MPFLENVTRGRGVPRERLLDVAHHYELFGGVSPINEQNRALIAALEPELRAHGIDLPIYFGNRNWRPFIADAMTEMRDDGVRNALAFLTSAYSSYSGCRQYRENLFDAQQAVGADAPAVSRLRMLYNHPGFVEANADHVRGGARAGTRRLAHRVRRAFDPGRDGAQLRVRGAAARDGAARRRGGRRRALARSCTSRAAGRRTCRGSSPTCPITSSRSTARAHRASSSRRSASSRITWRCCYDLDVEARETAERIGLPFARAAQRRHAPGVRRRDSRGDRRAARPGGAEARRSAASARAGTRARRTAACPATAGRRPGTRDGRQLGGGRRPAAANARRSRRATPASSSTSSAASAACRRSSSRRPSFSSRRVSTASRRRTFARRSGNGASS